MQRFLYDTAFGAAAGVTATLSNITMLKDGILIGGANTPNAGTIVLTGTNGLAENQYVKMTGVSPGTLVFDSKTASGDGQVQLGGGTFLFGANVTESVMGSLSGSIALSLTNANSDAVALTVGTATNGRSGTYSGVISGSGSITKKNATGDLVLSGANTYTGGTTIEAGRIRGTNATAFGTGDVVVKDGGTAFVAGAITVNNNFTIAGIGYTEVAGNLGALRIDSGANLTGKITLAGDARIGAHSNAGDNKISGNIIETGGARALEFGGTDANGKITLIGTASNTGGTIINLGNLLLGGDDRLNTAGALTIRGGTLNLQNYNQSTVALTIESGSVAGTGTLTASSVVATGIADATVSASLNFQGDLVKTGAGALILSGNNTYAGNIIVNEGALISGGANAVSFDSGRISMAAGTTLGFSLSAGGWTQEQINTKLADTSLFGAGVNLGIENSAAATFDASLLTGNCGLSKYGAGILTLGSGTDDAVANTYTGVTTVTAGTLTLNKKVGTNAIAGDLVLSGGTVDNGGTLTLERANQIADTANLTIKEGGKFAGGITETLNSITVIGQSGRFNPGSGSNLVVNSLNLVDINNGSGDFTSTVNFYSIAANSGNSTVSIGSGGFSMKDSWYFVGQAATGTNKIATIKLAGDFTGTGTNYLYAGNDKSNLIKDVYANIDLQAGTRAFNIIDGTTTIGTIIKNGTLNKTGAGTLVLVSTANSYGDTIVSEGTLQLGQGTGSTTGGAGGSFGTGSVTLADNTTLILKVGGINNQINLGNNATLRVNVGGLTNQVNVAAGKSALMEMDSGLTFAGTFGGAGEIKLGGSGYTQTRTFSTADNSGFTGTFSYTRGNYVISADNADWSGTNIATAADIAADNAAYLKITGAGTSKIKAISGLQNGFVMVGSATTLDVVSGEITRLTGGSASSSIMGASGTGAGITSSSGVLNINTNDKGLKIGTDTAYLGSGAVSIVDSAGTAVRIVKTGSGTLTLNTANTYTGGTTIHAGTLLMNNAGALGGGAVSVLGGALDLGGFTVANDIALGGSGTLKGAGTLAGKLSGNGTVSGAVTITGTLSPGNSPGTINFSDNVTLADGAKYIVEFEGGLFDKINIAGGKTLTIEAGAELYVVVKDDISAMLGQSFDVISGVVSGDFGVTTVTSGDYRFNVLQNAGVISLELVAIPEPSTYALLAGGILAGIALVRRRRK